MQYSWRLSLINCFKNARRKIPAQSASRQLAMAREKFKSRMNARDVIDPLKIYRRSSGPAEVTFMYHFAYY